MVLQRTAVAQSKVMFVDAISVNNEMVFSADDHVLIKLLRQQKGHGATKFIAEFPSKPWTE